MGFINTQSDPNFPERVGKCSWRSKIDALKRELWGSPSSRWPPAHVQQGLRPAIPLPVMATRELCYLQSVAPPTPSSFVGYGTPTPPLGTLTPPLKYVDTS
eukprot:scaffold20382_cov67-Attheya_sp.AAC.2